MSSQGEPVLIEDSPVRPQELDIEAELVAMIEEGDVFESGFFDLDG